MGTYSTSNGKRVSKEKIDRETAKAKKEFTRNFIEYHGFVFCEHCGMTNCSGIARSHIISVKEAQNTARAELAYDLDNLEMLGQLCHLEFESLPNIIREAWYKAKKQGVKFQEFINDHYNL